jgi:hypothetical protein
MTLTPSYKPQKTHGTQKSEDAEAPLARIVPKLYVCHYTFRQNTVDGDREPSTLVLAQDGDRFRFAVPAHIALSHRIPLYFQQGEGCRRHDGEGPQYRLASG